MKEFRIIATGRHPHFTVVLKSSENGELNRLLAVLGPPRRKQGAADTLTLE